MMRSSTAFSVTFAAVASASGSMAMSSGVVSTETSIPGAGNVFFTVANQTITVINSKTVTISCPASIPCTMSMAVNQLTLPSRPAAPLQSFSGNTASLITFVTRILPCPPGMTCQVASPTAMPTLSVGSPTYMNTTALGMGQPSFNQTAACNANSTNCVLTTKLFTTMTVTAFTTYCPSPTVFATIGQTFTITAATIVTVTCLQSAPCIMSVPVANSTATSAMPAVSGTGSSYNESTSGNSSSNGSGTDSNMGSGMGLSTNSGAASNPSSSMISMTSATSNGASGNNGVSEDNSANRAPSSFTSGASGSNVAASSASSASTTGFMITSNAIKLASGITSLVVIACVVLALQ